jgi:hypothetical protein
MNSTQRTVLVFGAVVAVGSGAYWLGSWRAAVVKLAPAIAADEMARLRQENDRLRAENAALAKPGTAPTTKLVKPAPATNAGAVVAAATAGSNAARLEQIRILAQVQQEKLATVNLPIVGRDGKVTDNFAKMFALTDGERQVLQQAVDQGRRRTDELLASSMTVTQEPDKLVFAMKPFEGGAEIYDGLMDSFAQTLGSERNAAFVALQTDDLGRMFSGFGAEQRTVTLSREQPPDGGEPRIVVQDLRKMPHGSAMSSTQQTDVTKLTAQYPWLVPYLQKVSDLPARSRPAGGRGF